MNTVYTFPVPTNPTSLSQAVWTDVAVYCLDEFLSGIGAINNTCREPVLPTHIADLMTQPEKMFRKQCDVAIAEMLDHAKGLFLHISQCTLDKTTHYQHGGRLLRLADFDPDTIHDVKAMRYDPWLKLFIIVEEI